MKTILVIIAIAMLLISVNMAYFGYAYFEHTYLLRAKQDTLQMQRCQIDMLKSKLLKCESKNYVNDFDGGRPVFRGGN